MNNFANLSLRNYPATAILILSLFAATSHAAGKQGQWVDLTHDFSADTIYWPTAEPFKIETVSAGKTEKGYYYSAYQFCAAEHGGTHLDAPIHFSEGKPTVDQIPLSSLIGKSIKIDVSKKALLDRDYQIPVFENIDHLDLVPHKGAEIVALPMKIKGGSGAPLRVVAFVTKTPD